ncbi:receptor-like protein EIX2 [Cucumis sativus]|uniref:receptor-like protein EIX2 n=1 Tax=Cucumis sativus TaxID=3659 RepID=UPI0002B42A71|nr:receptor-like protein EIX2 [Cucumis sativus]
MADKHFINCYVSLVWLLFVILPSTTTVGDYTSNNNCSSIEREALISFKQGLSDPSARLSSWVGHNCCQWLGITCDLISGKVIEIDLHNSVGSTISPSSIRFGVDEKQPWKVPEDFEQEFLKTCLRGKISSSLLELKHLNYLDLSLNNFEGAPIPYFFGMLTSLRYLNLSFANFSGQVPIYLGNLSNLKYLDLSTWNLAFFEWPSLHVQNLQWISGFSSLEYLNLGGVNLSSVQASNWMHAFNGGLSSLSELRLSQCGISSFDSSVTFLNLSSLRVLDLSGNWINSSIPLWLSNLANISTLYLSANHFQGTIPHDFIKLKNLQHLDLALNSEISVIGDHPPISPQNLCKLRLLDLSYSSFKVKLEEFLDSFSNCTRNSLESLDLSRNEFVGEIPNSLGTFENLRTLNLLGNQLWGSLPNSIGNLILLKYLDISYNSLNGTIPLSFGQLSNLVEFRNYQNSWKNITITETHLVNLTKLEMFTFKTKNKQGFVFNISCDWIPPFKLKVLYLENCLIGPQFPIWLQTQTQLVDITLTDVGISGSIPYEWISSISSQVTTLDLSNNLLNMSLSHLFIIPDHTNFVGESQKLLNDSTPLLYPNLIHLNLRNNKLWGPMPLTINDSMPNLFELDLSKNYLINGTIPSSIKTMNHIGILLMSDNQLSGEIFDDWSRLKLVLRVDLANNNLHGNIPTTIGLSTSLNVLKLENNNLHGEIPESLQNCSLLKSIDLSGNGFLNGNLPSWIGVAVSKIRLLNLRSNNFSGTIPRQWCNLHFLRILDLSNNRLFGELPSCLYNWSAFVHGDDDDNVGLGLNYYSKAAISYSYEENTRLVTKGREFEYYNTIVKFVLTIDLSRNKLSGEIPKEITKLIQLVTLNLSWNALVGTIPENIGAMKTLETLDLSLNYLSGRIPDSLASLNFLTHLNMSFNNLTGRIPMGNQLQTLEDPSIYEGNPYLCGPPLSRIKCPGDESSSNVPISTSEEEDDKAENDSEMVGFYISMAIGFPFGINILFFTISTNEARRLFYFRVVDRVNYNILQTIAFLTIGLRRMIIWRR